MKTNLMSVWKYCTFGNICSVRNDSLSKFISTSEFPLSSAYDSFVGGLIVLISLIKGHGPIIKSLYSTNSPTRTLIKNLQTEIVYFYCSYLEPSLPNTLTRF